MKGLGTSWLHHQCQGHQEVPVQVMKGTLSLRGNQVADRWLHPEGSGETRRVSPHRPKVESDEEKEDHDADHLPVSRP